jgi:hypothetical protein
MPQRALAIALLLLALGAASATALAGGAPTCCANSAGAPMGADCGDRALTGPASGVCCELLPAEVAPQRGPSLDSSRVLASVSFPASSAPASLAAPRRPELLSRTRALQPEPDPTIVLRI